MVHRNLISGRPCCSVLCHLLISTLSFTRAVLCNGQRGIWDSTWEICRIWGVSAFQLSRLDAPPEWEVLISECT